MSQHCWHLLLLLHRPHTCSPASSIRRRGTWKYLRGVATHTIGQHTQPQLMRLRTLRRQVPAWRVDVIGAGAAAANARAAARCCSPRAVGVLLLQLDAAARAVGRQTHTQQLQQPLAGRVRLAAGPARRRLRLGTAAAAGGRRTHQLRACTAATAVPGILGCGWRQLRAAAARNARGGPAAAADAGGAAAAAQAPHRCGQRPSEHAWGWGYGARTVRG